METRQKLSPEDSKRVWRTVEIIRGNKSNRNLRVWEETKLLFDIDRKYGQEIAEDTYDFLQIVAK